MSLSTGPPPSTGACSGSCRSPRVGCWAWAMSALTRRRAGDGDGTSCGSCAPVAATSRARTSSRKEPRAPSIDLLPTSSWSFATSSCVCAAGAASSRAVTALWQDRGCRAAATRPTSRRRRSRPRAGCRRARGRGRRRRRPRRPPRGERLQQRRVAVGVGAPHRHELGLRVEHEPLAHRPVEVDRERRQPHGPPGSRTRCRSTPPSRRAASRPATVSSRSSQVWASTPP